MANGWAITWYLKWPNGSFVSCQIWWWNCFYILRILIHHTLVSKFNKDGTKTGLYQCTKRKMALILKKSNTEPNPSCCYFLILSIGVCAVCDLLRLSTCPQQESFCVNVLLLFCLPERYNKWVWYKTLWVSLQCDAVWIEHCLLPWVIALCLPVHLGYS